MSLRPHLLRRRVLGLGGAAALALATVLAANVIAADADACPNCREALGAAESRGSEGTTPVDDGLSAGSPQTLGSARRFNASILLMASTPLLIGIAGGVAVTRKLS